MSQVEQVRIEIETAKHMIELDECLNRLVRNKDFLKLIDKEFMEKEPIRLVQLLAHPGMQDEKSQQEIRNQMIGVAYFRQFLARTEAMADQARQALPERQETEVELLREEAEA